MFQHAPSHQPGNAANASPDAGTLFVGSAMTIFTPGLSNIFRSFKGLCYVFDSVNNMASNNTSEDLRSKPFSWLITSPRSAKEALTDPKKPEEI